MNNISKTIEWADKSWNAISGCSANCSYCYARKIYHRFKMSFKPQFHKDRLSEPLKLKKPSRIFVSSAGEFWDPKVKPIWRDEVYNVIKACPEHTFLILTKQSQNLFQDFDKVPENVWLGVTITHKQDSHRILDLLAMENQKFISIEPMLDTEYSEHIYLVDWLIVGAFTGPGSNRFKPRLETIKEIVKRAKSLKIPVFMKSNLKNVWKKKLIQEVPR